MIELHLGVEAERLFRAACDRQLIAQESSFNPRRVPRERMPWDGVLPGFLGIPVFVKPQMRPYGWRIVEFWRGPWKNPAGKYRVVSDGKLKSPEDRLRRILRDMPPVEFKMPPVPRYRDWAIPVNAPRWPGMLGGF